LHHGSVRSPISGGVARLGQQFERLVASRPAVRGERDGAGEPGVYQGEVVARSLRDF